LADFLRSNLTLRQKTLLAHQKTRFSRNSDSSEDGDGDDHDAYAQIDCAELEK